MSKELHPSGLVEKIELLKVENKALREGQGGQTALAVCCYITFKNLFIIYFNLSLATS